MAATAGGQAQSQQSPYATATPYGQASGVAQGFAAYAPQTRNYGMSPQQQQQAATAWTMPKVDLMRWANNQPQQQNLRSPQSGPDPSSVWGRNAAIVQQINDTQANQQVGTYLGDGAPPAGWGQTNYNPQQMISTANQMTQQGWQNPFGQLAGSMLTPQMLSGQSFPPQYQGASSAGSPASGGRQGAGRAALDAALRDPYYGVTGQARSALEAVSQRMTAANERRAAAHARTPARQAAAAKLAAAQESKQKNQERVARDRDRQERRRAELARDPGRDAKSLFLAHSDRTAPGMGAYYSGINQDAAAFSQWRHSRAEDAWQQLTPAQKRHWEIQSAQRAKSRGIDARPLQALPASQQREVVAYRQQLAGAERNRTAQASKANQAIQAWYARNPSYRPGGPHTKTGG
jgi:hypothetical protein